MARLPPMLTMYRCINSRRIRRGGGPVRYTGWTVPTYNQSQQQYGYTNDQNTYNMNNYPQASVPPAEQGQYSYQGPPQVESGGPAYYDATQTSAQGTVLVVFSGLIFIGGYQPPAFPPPAGKRSNV